MKEGRKEVEWRETRCTLLDSGGGKNVIFSVVLENFSVYVGTSICLIKHVLLLLHILGGTSQ